MAVKINSSLPFDPNVAFVKAQTLPTDSGYNAWSFDPTQIANSASYSSGLVSFQKIRTPLPFACTQIAIVVRAGGAGNPLPSNCYLGVYSKTGQRLGISAAQDQAWLTSGTKPAILIEDYDGALTFPGGPEEYVYGAIFVGTVSQSGLTFGSRGQQVGNTVNVGLINEADTFANPLSSVPMPRTFTAASGANSLAMNYDIIGSKTAGTLACNTRSFFLGLT